MKILQWICFHFHKKAIHLKQIEIRSQTISLSEDRISNNKQNKKSNFLSDL